ncbi:sensor histidine kinase [Sphingobacterium sp. DK4209]|uniref:histidine kinase n=1 Tax=Sphingobacterium zhuxiongii TaxID=2662364 RepID=A0A5Q0QCX4_9SPHI|nr:MULTISPECIES: ATP-binding protein [unclassified Sphingobacterium]MVZ66803.1 sensor histidine kinase [Sphingobacterium sp. DK4209]QGA28037.1 sensor histidine kinase [Sphingobacterium sp. dk4302]
MNFRSLILIISLIFSLLLAGMNYYHEQHLPTLAFIAIISFILIFSLLNYVFQKFVYERIKAVYKLIHNLKLGKELKDALGDHKSDDPIGDAEKEVRDWAKQKTSEINQLKAQEKFRKEFLSNISHEFKTPLFAIQGYIETLQDGMIEDNPDMAVSFLKKASKNLDRLSYLIHDLDEIAKLESGQVLISKEKFDIQILIRETIDYLEDKASDSEIQLKFNPKSHNPILVKADRKKIQQVLVNLIDNSIKYGSRGGKTQIKAIPLIDQILIEITDNGQGIEEKNLPRVFERFFRTDKSRSRDIGGSGLGLAIVKHIIEAHQQNVHVRSTEGIGTTFSFTLEKA